jgi:histidine kinase/DNA gyrase B/HSP90-like ATPase
MANDDLFVASHTARDLLRNAALFKTDKRVGWEYVSNGLQYVDVGTNPIVKVTLDSKKKRIAVEDNGRGMDWRGLQNFFVMHGENVDKREGKPGRGRFGTGTSAAFGIADVLRVTTVREGKRSRVELRRADIDSMVSNDLVPVRTLEKEVSTGELNGTAVEIEGLHLGSLDQAGIIRYIERHLAKRPRNARVYVNNHECEYLEPPVDREARFRPTGEAASLLGDVELVIKVSKVPLDADLRGISIFSNGVWHETTLAGSEGREMTQYVFGEVDVPRLDEGAAPIRPFALSRSMRLNASNRLVQATYAFIGQSIETVRRELQARAEGSEAVRRLRHTVKTSRYPRPGQPIAPRTLEPIFDVPVPRELLPRGTRGVRLCDLDSSAWQWLGPETCQRLADLVIETLKKRYDRFPGDLLDVLVPGPPAALMLEDLHLEPRTYNCLSRERARVPFSSFGSRRIRDLREIKGFGAKCLLDLMTALEAAGSVESRDGSNAADAASVARAAKRMRSRWYADAVRRDDPRLGEFVRASNPSSETLGAALDHIMAMGAGVSDPPRIARLLATLRSRIRACFRQRLEQELWDFTRPAGNERNRTMVATYLGWDGDGGRTLQAVADDYGLTRERVRQVATRVTSALSSKRPFAPALDRVLEFVADRTPGVVADLEAALLAEDLTERRFQLNVLPYTASMMGRELSFDVASQHGQWLAVNAQGADLASEIWRAARRAVEHWGAATVDDIVERVVARPSSELATTVLSSRPDFVWLDRESGWFWLGSVPRNRLRNQIEKIMAVAGRIEVGELRAGVGRHHRMKGFAPPRQVLLEFCRQMPAYRVDGETVLCDPPPPVEEVLSETEQIIYRMLHQEGPVMQRAKLEERCLAAGMPRSTFHVYLDYSPVLSRYARGVYGLRGAAVSPEVVESLIPTVKRHRVIRDYGWSGDRRIWLALRVSEAMVKSGVFGVPAAMKQFLEGEFRLITSDDDPVGTLVIRENGAWGLSPFFRRRGVEAGDYLVLTLDLTTRSAAVQLGDVAMVEDFQEGGPES